MRIPFSLVVAVSLTLAAIFVEPALLASARGGLVHAAGRYVATTGSDASPGTVAQPWQTLQFAFDALTPGDTLYIRGGTYFEAPTASVSGTAVAPIVIRGYPGESVILDSGSSAFQTAGNSDWELVDAAIGEYRSAAPVASGHIYAYVAGIAGYENERVALVPYTNPTHFRATTDVYGGPLSSFYVGPGTYRVGDRVHIRLSKTADLRDAEARYGTVFATEDADPRLYSIILSTESATLEVSGAYLTFHDLTVHQARETVRLTSTAHHVTFDGVTVWHGNSAIEVEGAHDLSIRRSRIYGDYPYWVFWSDMKDSPAPADRLRGTAIDLSGGAHDVEIAYCHVRGSGNDLIGTQTNEYDIFIHHNRIENAGDDALEIEGSIDVGRVEIYENYILNSLIAIAPGQATPQFTGPLLVYRNVVAMLRNPPVNRAAGINSWNGGHRFGYEYMFKHKGSAPDSSRNAHYYHNTLVLLNSDDRGMNITPTSPAHCRIMNNVEVTVSGQVNRDFRTGLGFELDGNLYWKLNDVAGDPLVGGYDTVSDFNTATGYEPNGLGATPTQGTDPLLSGFGVTVVDPLATRWEIDAASELPSLSDFIPSVSSPTIGAAIPIAPVPGVGSLPDTRASSDIGAYPFGTAASEFDVFPFDPTASSIPAATIDDVSVTEGHTGTTIATFTVTLDSPAFGGETIDYATADGSATAGDADYVAASGTLSFGAGETTKTLDVTVNGDLILEADQTFVVNLSSASGVHLGDAQGQGTVFNDDVAPSLAIRDSAAAEGHAGTFDATLTVSFSHLTDDTVTVDFATRDGAATTANSDYVATSGTLTLLPRASSGSIMVPLVGDVTRELDEVLHVDLSNPSGATIADTTGDATITNDDPLPTLSINDRIVAEGHTGTAAVAFEVSMSHPNDQAVTVDWTTRDGSATVAGNDYLAASGTLTIPAYSTTGSVSAYVVGDVSWEFQENLYIDLSNPLNATIADTSGTLIIANDDVQPGLAVDDIVVAEGDADTTSAIFTVTLSKTAEQVVTVDYSTGDATATVSGGDYLAASGTLSFPPGSTSVALPVLVLGDSTWESDEDLSVTLSNPSNAGITDGSGTAMIQNDDAEPSLAIGDAAVTEGDADSVVAVFHVSLSNPSDQDVTVAYTTADGTATLANNDYDATSGTLTIPAGALADSIEVAVNGDETLEGDETFTLDLSQITGATLADGSGTGTIGNDDLLPGLSIADLAVGEGDADSSIMVFTVSLTNPTDQEVTVDFATSDGTATIAHGDYAATSGTLTIPAKSPVGVIAVTAYGDLTLEADEAFNITLSNPSNVVIVDGVATGTLTNDDSFPSLSIDDVAAPEGDNDTTAVTFTVSLSNLTDLDVVVDFASSDGSATVANGDYLAVSGTLTIAAKTISATLQVPVIGDPTFESDETFTIELSNLANAAFADSSGAATITNDDDAPSLSIADITVTEGDADTTAMAFAVSLDHPTDQDVTIDYQTIDGTATLANNDYAAAGGTLTIPADSTTTTVTVSVIGDVTLESDETLGLVLSNPAGALLADGLASGTITNDDTLPSLSIDDVAVTEGNADTTLATFTVSLSNPTDQPVTADYQTADGTATISHGDYVAASGTLTIPAKASSTTVTVPVLGDVTLESDETFTLSLTQPVNAALADSVGLGTIGNDDILPSLTIDDVVVTEGDTDTVSAVLTVTLSNPTDQAVTVDYQTVDGTATSANGDYASASGTVTIAAKTTFTTITIAVNGDVTLESGETFTVALSNPVQAVIADSAGTVTITNDDPFPSLTIADDTLTEGAADTTSASFTVTLSNPTDQPVTVDFRTIDATATTADGDYVATSGTLTIPAKTLSAAVVVGIVGDPTFEDDESFIVTLDASVNATIADSSATGTIENDDDVPGMSIDDVVVTEGDADSVLAIFTVSLTHPTEHIVTVDYATRDGSATLANGDYAATSGTLTFEPLSVSLSFDVIVNGDVTLEGDELFIVDLTNVTEATLVDGSALGTISDDDVLPSVSIDDVQVTEGHADTVMATFTATLSNPTDLAVTVGYQTAEGTATLANGDFVAVSGTVTIPAKSFSAPISVPVLGDVTLESDEVFEVRLTQATNAAIADSAGAGTILNDDNLPSLSIDDVQVTEGDADTAAAIFTVTLSNPTDQDVTVDYQAAEGTATLANGDFLAAAGTVTIAAKTTSATVPIDVLGDITYESDETFTVVLSAPAQATIADDTGVGTILNDDTVPALSIADVAVVEGNADTVIAALSVSLSHPTDREITVDYATADGTATAADADYLPVSGTLTIAAKTLDATILVSVLGDSTRESDEVLDVQLSQPTNATLADSLGSATISNDDPIPSATIADVAVVEGLADTVYATFTVSLSHPTDQAVTIDFATRDSTAMSVNGDYAATSGTLTILANAVQGTIDVVVYGDATLESDEFFVLDLSQAVHATLADSAAVGTITNDDDQPTLTVADATLAEGNGGTRFATFVLNLSNPSDQDILVDFETRDGSATTADNDYQAASGTMAIPLKSASGAIAVIVKGDTAWEPDETFELILTAVVGATLVDSVATGTIENDDTPTDFVHVADAALSDAGHGQGVAMGDLDGDGDLDLYLAKSGANRMLRNDGGTFVDATTAPLDDPGLGKAVALGDLDNDGDLDLYLTNLGDNKLFRNEGGGVFVDATVAPLDDPGSGLGAALADIDNDGDLDLYVTNSPGSNKCFRNEGGGTFVDATDSVLGDPSSSRTAVFGDIDEDGDLDLYVVNGYSESNKLLRNEGNGVFVDVTSGPLGNTDGGKGAAFGDIDDDGDLDLYVSNVGAANLLLLNDGTGNFTDATTAPLDDADAGYGVAFGDVDNDGDLDLYVANHNTRNKLFRNDGAGTFADVSDTPVDDPDKSLGVSMGDVDGDGDLDLYVVNSGQPDKLFRNDAAATGHQWLHAQLEGTISNASGIGARVRLVSAGGSRVREITAGSGYGSQNSLAAEFGLGTDTQVDSIIVRWPSGLVQYVDGMSAGQMITIVEDHPLLSADPFLAPPTAFALRAGRPNPFAQTATIEYDLPRRSTVSLRIYDAAGRVVRELVNTSLEAGRHHATWDGTGTLGRRLAPGVYLYRLQTPGFAKTRKLVLLR